ncbi:MAG: NADPH:quinone reductase [Pseudorhodoplanes sp.]|jgi:NADPH2:quinone reductase|nr:NADPH:quinone reductase [Pseudorhodoplanes sp.]
MQSHCVFYEKTGPARDVLVLGEMEPRAPEPDEVLVRLRFSGVNPADVKARGGAPGRTMPFKRIVPHHDGAGIVEDVGANVDRALIGQPVWLFSAQYQRPFGTASQYITIDRTNVVMLPYNVPLKIGACLGIPVMTAWHAVLNGPPIAGRKVLVTGGAGAVGHYAVQLARRHGAFVIATVSSDDKAREAKDAGAHVTINYRDADAIEHAMQATGGHGADVIVDVDTTVNAEFIAKIIAQDGHLASYGSSLLTAQIPVRDFRLRCATMRFMTLYHLSNETLRAIAAGINAILETDGLLHRIAKEFPLSETAAAHEAIECGRISGKALIRID